MIIDNSTIDALIKFFLVIIPLGATVRVIYCAIKAMTSEEDKPTMKKRAKNVIAFTVVAELAVGLVALVLGYYS